MKITVLGAGAVGATCADNIARKELSEELILLDIREGFAEGKAIDMMQTSNNCFVGRRNPGNIKPRINEGISDKVRELNNYFF